MKRLNVLTILVMLLMPALAMGEGLPGPIIGAGYHWYPCHGLPCVCLDFTAWIQVSGHGVSKVLDAINNVQTRQKLAEEWFQFHKQSVAKTWEFQEGCLELQKAHLRLQREIEQLRLAQLKLQAEIEKLQAEKLRLELEKLQKETSKQASDSSGPRAAVKTATAE